MWTNNSGELANDRCGVNVVLLTAHRTDLDWKLCRDSAFSQRGTGSWIWVLRLQLWYVYRYSPRAVPEPTFFNSQLQSPDFYKHLLILKHSQLYTARTYMLNVNANYVILGWLTGHPYCIWSTDVPSIHTYISLCISWLFVTQVDKDVALLRAPAFVNEPSSCGHKRPCAGSGVSYASSTAGSELIRSGWAGAGVWVSFPVQRCQRTVHVVGRLWMA